MFNYNANSPFFSASATTTLHDIRVGTSTLLGTAGISNIFSGSPGGCSSTIGCSHMAFGRIVGESLGIVSSATFSLYGSGSVSVVMFGLSSPSGVVSIIGNRGVNAAIRG